MRNKTPQIVMNLGLGDRYSDPPLEKSPTGIVETLEMKGVLSEYLFPMEIPNERILPRNSPNAFLAQEEGNAFSQISERKYWSMRGMRGIRRNKDALSMEAIFHLPSYETMKRRSSHNKDGPVGPQIKVLRLSPEVNYAHPDNIPSKEESKLDTQGFWVAMYRDDPFRQPDRYVLEGVHPEIVHDESGYSLRLSSQEFQSPEAEKMVNEVKERKEEYIQQNRG